MTGKIGRGVLRRVKGNLENVDARLTGVILNKVKSDAGPDYYQYHSYYYYGSETDLKKAKKIKKIRDPKKSNQSKPKRKTVNV
jgi:Mrp family chromosome partitioning ATPase